ALTVLYGSHVRVRRDGRPDDVDPARDEGLDELRGGDSELATDARDGVAQRYRLVSTRHRDTTSMRPARTARFCCATTSGGRAPAVVSKVWPGGRLRTSAAARCASSSLKTSSRSNTGAAPASSRTTT